MRSGRVRVNGRVVTELGTRVDPDRDRVELDGRRVQPGRSRWILFHKPAGTLTTRSDARGRATIYDRLPEELRGLRYVGRLDLDTEGLLLLTNEGDAANRLAHPSGEVEREYLAGVKGVPAQEALARLVQGVELEDGPARAAAVRSAGRETLGAVLSLVVQEGRKREVRRMLDAIGHPARWLRRVRFGPQKLGSLAPGAWRELTDAEVEALRAAPRVRRTRGAGRPSAPRPPRKPR